MFRRRLASNLPELKTTRGRQQVLSSHTLSKSCNICASSLRVQSFWIRCRSNMLPTPVHGTPGEVTAPPLRLPLSCYLGLAREAAVLHQSNTNRVARGNLDSGTGKAYGRIGSERAFRRARPIRLFSVPKTTAW